MPVTAYDVAAELRARYPGNLDRLQIHKLLYFCQGHHLADLGERLFTDTLSAWDLGPVVGSLWKLEKEGLAPPPRTPLDVAQLNTVEYVLHRYGALSGTDLMSITHRQMPWIRGDRDRLAAGARRATIEVEWIRQEFVEARDLEDRQSGLDREEVRQWLAGAHDRLAEAGDPQPDDLDRIRALLSAAGE